MNPHHNHVYRNQKEADRIISLFGRKPLDSTRQKLQEALLAEKQKFLDRELVKTRMTGRGRDRTDERER